MILQFAICQLQTGGAGQDLMAAIDLVLQGKAVPDQKPSIGCRLGILCGRAVPLTLVNLQLRPACLHALEWPPGSVVGNCIRTSRCAAFLHLWELRTGRVKSFDLAGMELTYVFHLLQHQVASLKG